MFKNKFYPLKMMTDSLKPRCERVQGSSYIMPPIYHPTKQGLIGIGNTAISTFEMLIGYLKSLLLNTNMNIT